MTDIASVYAIFADEDEASRIGRAMIEARLAACVNILGPCRSVYRWQDAVQESAEVPAIFKTRVDGIDRLIAAIADAHSYDLPAITAWPVAATLPDYADWIARNSTG